MPAVTHQTVRLGPGPHTGPNEGACVMELASMLAGEPFSDHPASVSPVLGAFLRTYNDLVEDRHRQSLYRFAALVIGTRADDAAEAMRGEACARWVAKILADGARSRRRQWALARAARTIRGRTWEAQALAAGRLAARLTQQQGDAGHAQVEELVEGLVALTVPCAGRPSAAREPAMTA